MRLLVLPAIVLSSLMGILPISDLQKEGTTDYDNELEQIRKQIVEVEDHALTPPIEMKRARKFIHLLYRHASLTMNYVDFEFARDSINNASRQIDAWEELHILKAALDLKFHQLIDMKESLRNITTLADSPQVKILKADLALQEGRYGEAKSGYESAINKNRTWDNLARLAYLKSQAGHIAEADKLYVEAQATITSKEMRSFSWLEVQRGILVFNCGRHDEALAHYQRANKAYSGYWLVEAHVAEVLGALRKFDQAVAIYEKVIARTAKPELQQALGDLYLFMGKPNLAKPWHEKALAGYLASVQRGEVHYFHHLARYYADVREDGAEAVKWASTDLQLRKNYSTHDAMAWALYRNGQFLEAVDEINAALSFGIRDAHVFFRAAMIHQAAGLTAESKRFLKQAAEINPNFAEFHAHH